MLVGTALPMCRESNMRRLCPSGGRGSMEKLALQPISAALRTRAGNALASAWDGEATIRGRCLLPICPAPLRALLSGQTLAGFPSGLGLDAKAQDTSHKWQSRSPWRMDLAGRGESSYLWR